MTLRRQKPNFTLLLEQGVIHTYIGVEPEPANLCDVEVWIRRRGWRCAALRVHPTDALLRPEANAMRHWWLRLRAQELPLAAPVPGL